MIRKQIVATTEIDKQGQHFSVDALERYANAFSNQPDVPRMSINHDSTLLPIGKTLSGKLVQMNNGEIGLEVLIDDFADKFEAVSGPGGEKLYCAHSNEDQRPFKDFQFNDEQKLTIMLNPLHFSKDDYKEVSDYLINQCNARIETTIAKSWMPDPEIVINLVSVYLIGLMGKEILTKTTEKLSDSISDDLVKSYTVIKKVIKLLAEKLSSFHQTTYIFADPNQPIELVIRAKKAETVIFALDTAKDSCIAAKYKEFVKYTNDSIKKMQFVYDEKNGKWEFTYLCTDSGKVIGTEACYKRTMKMYHEVMESPTAGFSVGGTAAVSSEENTYA